MKLQQKIAMFFIGIILTVIISISLLSYNQMKGLMKKQLGDDLLKMAQIVARMDDVVENVGLKGGSATIQNVIERTRLKTGLLFIVVMDMDGIRYSHPVEERIGKPFKGGDESRVLVYGEEYISESAGSLGKSLRAFSPIYRGGVQVGAVSVGMLMGRVNNEIYEKMYSFLPVLLFGLLIGAIGTTILSYNIKKTILGLEPEEIALIVKQKETVLQSINEGILALDTCGRITLFNKAASNILQITNADIGKNISEFFKDSEAQQAIKSGVYVDNIEVKVRPGVTIMCRYNPMKDERDELIGIVVNFQDLTEVKRLAEELTGIKKMTWSLRAQNHEFMNKLHTISGLIQLEEYDEAIHFISSTAKSRNELSSILTEQIKDVTLAALILAKYNKAEEARVKFFIDQNCRLTKLPKYMTSEELTSVIGNIIENSLEAVSSDGTGVIKLKINENDRNIIINISDNGPGILDSVSESIYRMGTTTKQGQRGYGMYIVKKIIDEAQGEINYKIDGGTHWFIKIPINRSE